MILYGRIVEQAVDHHHRGTFIKEVIVTAGTPLAMVRKRVAGSTQTRAPVLLVHGFGQNRYAWHLPSRSFANYLAQRGFDVFNVDLRGHGRSRSFGGRRSQGVHDYIEHDLPQAVAEVRALSGGRPVFLVGHSLGGLVSYAAAPSLGDQIAAIVSIGSPYHFTRGSAFLAAVRALNGAMRTLGVPLGNMPIYLGPVGVALRGLKKLASGPLYPLPLRGWHEGAVEHHVLDEHLELAFDRASLDDIRNLFDWAWEKRFGGKSGYAQRFQELDIPLLVVAGDNDELAPAASVRPAYDKSRSRDKSFLTFPLGHIDLLVGREAPQTLWPAVADWLVARS